MMDTGAHRRTASNSVSSGDVKPALASANVPINFAMKFLATSATQHSSHLQNITNNTNTSIHGIQQHPLNGTIAASAATTASTPLLAVKLEPRVPSPCTADLVKGETRVPSPCVKDLSYYLTKSAAASGQQLVVNGINSMNTLNGTNGTALSLKQSTRLPISVDDVAYLPGQTILPSSNSSDSQSPPPLLSNGHSIITPTNHNHINSPSQFSIKAAAMKRDFDDAFGASSTTASLPTSTNSPSPPPLLTNGHHLHQAMVNSATMLSNGGSNKNLNIASPTSSSFSDFASTGKCQ